MKFATSAICLGLLGHFAAGIPTVPNTTDRVTQLAQNLQVILQGTKALITGALESQQFEQVVDILRTVPQLISSPPSSVDEALQRLLAVNASHPADLFEYVANLRALNLVDSVDSLLAYLSDDNAENSFSNNNPPAPTAIHPKKMSCDAPYTVSESDLRSAIYIPPDFTFGKKPPVILFPGTGSTGYLTYKGNFISLLSNDDFADPVWVNVPGFLLNDAQTHAEYAAYAINYISAITQQNVTIVAWSQGNIDTQWAFKYWPSTRFVTSDHIAISPDYAGTIISNTLFPPGVPLPASVIQQRYLESSAFITNLRADDGDSGYVSTTTIYSGVFDEIVEPQQGIGASAFLKDVRGVGVTNNEVQSVCLNQIAGTVYTHEGVMFNPLTFALFRDAMQHDGPGRIERLDLAKVCSEYLTPGLDIGDFVVTENSAPIATLGILLHEPRMVDELPLRKYALLPPVSNLGQCG